MPARPMCERDTHLATPASSHLYVVQETSTLDESFQPNKHSINIEAKPTRALQSTLLYHATAVGPNNISLFLWLSLPLDNDVSPFQDHLSAGNIDISFSGAYI